MKPIEPAILRENVYFKPEGMTRSERRANEKFYREAVAVYLAQLGYEVDTSGVSVIAERYPVNVVFHYWETSNRCHKTLKVTINGKRSNVNAIAKERE